jgi:hypothetical protein
MEPVAGRARHTAMTRMPGLRRTVLLAFVLCSGVVGGCATAGPGGPGTSGPGSGGTGPTGGSPDDLMVRVSQEGGFVGPMFLASRMPMVSVYRDGRVLTPGPVPAIYPGPPLLTLEVRRISPADVQRLVDRTLAAGIGGQIDAGQPAVADVPSTRFTVRTPSGLTSTAVNALGMNNGVSPAQKAVRDRLEALQATLTDPTTMLGAGAVSSAGPYQPTMLAALATAWTDPGQPGPTPREIVWPGPALPGAPIGGPGSIGCVAVSGQQLNQVLAAAGSATAVTPWASGGHRWSLTLRPLLPDETSCAALTGSG